jgi:hypothetical protein
MYPAILNRISARIFQIDGCGALLSGGGLVLLLVFQPFFGMPADVLYKLLLLPAIFALYTFTCHRNSNEKPQELASRHCRCQYCLRTRYGGAGL